MRDHVRPSVSCKCAMAEPRNCIACQKNKKKTKRIVAAATARAQYRSHTHINDQQLYVRPLGHKSNPYSKREMKIARKFEKKKKKKKKKH
jgi:hypothetical protein